MTKVEILDHLRTSGYRLTGPRRALVEALLLSATPLTAEDLHQKVKLAGMNLSTVYRNLSTFVEMGWLDAVPGMNGEKHYQVHSMDDGAMSILCLDCGKLNQVAGASTPGLSATVRDLGFKADTLRVTLAAHCEHVCERKPAN